MRACTAAAATVVVTFALMLGGCAPSFPDISVTETPTAPAQSPAPTTAPTQTAAPTADPAALACDTVLDESSLDAFAAHDYQLSDDFAQRAVDQGWPEAAFVTSGGLLCQWGVVRSDASEHYGLAPITAEQRATQIARLGAAGYSNEIYGDGELFTGALTEGVTLHYLIAGDHWFVGFSTARIDEIRRNAGLS
ncbi:hypothetical protein [Conyzicola sp.]|uniref:hypothetical protein n=1 Tax=Conyzicola sp. TaxID=1969404 RepID=UPI003989283A